MIVRESRRERFTVVSNAALEDSRLSFQAKGLLVYLLSKPDGWRVSREHLATVGTNGISSVRAILTELEECGYLSRVRKAGEHGHFTWESIIHENPLPSAENPPMVNPPMEKPPVVNRTLVNTERVKKDVVKTEVVFSSFASPSDSPTNKADDSNIQVIGKKSPKPLTPKAWQAVQEAMQSEPKPPTLNAIRAAQRYSELTKSEGIDLAVAAQTEATAAQAEATAPKTKNLGTRIPDNFTPSAKMRELVVERFPGVDLLEETDKFCDYWKSQAGAKARKADWQLTWKTWIRTAYERAGKPKAGQYAPPKQQGVYRTPAQQAAHERGMSTANFFLDLEKELEATGALSPVVAPTLRTESRGR